MNETTKIILMVALGALLLLIAHDIKNGNLRLCSGRYGRRFSISQSGCLIDNSPKAQPPGATIIKTP